ncbi:hypothetical protein P879_11911 [Paragonimus westermani]|uniref:C-type lectin domain-containing protein n=1 Tax=Paragonimus westermani TaxID=34504 RepID=A0A8T0D4F8_9TREM|nr:hypothetical protein P879_11911 [Paragonimus westermani]
MCSIIHIAALLLAINLGETACPANFMESQSGVCVTHVGTSKTFCEAAKKCEKNGKSLGLNLFLVGRDATAIAQIFPYGRSVIWTGVNQLLITRNTEGDGWYDTNPKTPTYTTGKDFPWGTAQPEGNEPVTMYNPGDNTFHDYPAISQSASLDVFCQYIGEPSGTVSAVKFTSNFPVRLTDLVQTNLRHVGCFLGVFRRYTMLECAMRCASNSACRSVYINIVDGRCVPVMYADSLLAWHIAGSGKDWKRFAKAEVSKN